MQTLFSKNFNDADEVKNPPKAKVEVVKLGNVNASKLVLQPGWVWSECINPPLVAIAAKLGISVLLFLDGSVARMMMAQK